MWQLFSKNVFEINNMHSKLNQRLNERLLVTFKQRKAFRTLEHIWTNFMIDMCLM